VIVSLFVCWAKTHRKIEFTNINKTKYFIGIQF